MRRWTAVVQGTIDLEAVCWSGTVEAEESGGAEAEAIREFEAAYGGFGEHADVGHVSVTPMLSEEDVRDHARRVIFGRD